ncbi:histone-fold-containing protein [Patellaria atrata CBS 101060]|uniref:NCT transcriptional regulatory complex subunit A n=1 Tax=Patellaria atrata CBS 101060 TaxID=1346257 RepID=A0A9P4S6K8_9PEZI|nr:histone-fold-containing protein [Patellaria atrata CBS 101060]
METAGTRPDLGIEVRTKFPVARIKRIMQADDDVGKVAQVTPVAVSKALELFMISLVTKAAAEAKSKNQKRVSAAHLKAAVMKDDQFDFLRDIVERVQDAPASKDEDSDEVPGGKKKRSAGGRRKRKESDEL